MPKTVDQVRAAFVARGDTLKDWAARHGFPVRVVYGVMSGSLKATRGKSHAIAVALGLKARPTAEDEDAA